MRIIKVGKYVFLRHWFQWYSIHQMFGGSDREENVLKKVYFPFKED